MSMSQEEIEALMSGADDIQIDDVSEEQELNEEESSSENYEPQIEDEISIEDALEENISSGSENSNESIEEVNVDDILAGIDGIVNDEESIEEVNVDDILAGIDGVIDDTEMSDSKNEDSYDIASEPSEMEDKINSSQYPLPVSDENKVVNQLNEVADDSEEKASQIFDVLSFILDENNDIVNYNKKMSDFIEKQIVLLESLSAKFPNVSVFQEHLDSSKDLIDLSKQLTTKVDAENNKVFEAMELMQYHDINRQKIERVMAVIKKLSSYLNGIFEDDSDRDEVQIAKHISGDSNDIVDADDLESLISEFSN